MTSSEKDSTFTVRKSFGDEGYDVDRINRVSQGWSIGYTFKNAVLADKAAQTLNKLVEADELLKEEA